MIKKPVSVACLCSIALCASALASSATAAPGFGAKGSSLSSDGYGESGYAADESRGLLETMASLLGIDQLLAVKTPYLEGLSGTAGVEEFSSAAHSASGCEESEVAATMSTLSSGQRSLVDLLAEFRAEKEASKREPVYFAF